MGESNGVFQGKAGEPTVGMVRGRGRREREGARIMCNKGVLYV